MTIVVIFILAAVWAVVLVPPWLRRRSEGDPTDSIVSFRRHLSTLQRTAPMRGVSGHVVNRGMTRSAVRRRRREVLSRLAVATGLALIMAVVLQGLAIVAFVVVAGLSASYIALLIRAERRRSERHAKVRYLPQAGDSESSLVLTRSVSQ